MLEHSAMYFNVPTPMLDEESTPFPDFYTRLGPCEVQDPVWAKMSALAPGVKKRKKSENKPQAQINKCNNEKRRREQENIYIEELAELISANFADMSSLSVKPDKCAILQETVNQIRSIKQREGTSQSSDPVQQGEVSSSRPTILSTDVYGPLLLEALEGFLFVVNAEGKVEHVTKNVSNFIKYTEEEVLGKSIYNFIHHGDHARFSSSLLPMPIGWASEPTNKSRSFSCRLLVKPDDPEDSTSEEQQQQLREPRYELMFISSTQLNQGTVTDDESGDSGPCLMCVASRITHRDRASIFQVEQFTTKLDTSGKIIGVDTSGVTAYSQFLNKELMDRLLQDLCVPQDTHKLTQHLRDTISSGQATSVTFRLRLGHDRYLNVQTKSKLFKANPHSTDTDFIMSTHSINGENDSTTRPNDPGGGGGTNISNNTIGDPLMTSVVNGTRNGPLVNANSDTHPISLNNSLNNANPPIFSAAPFLIENDIGVDISSTWSDIWLENHQDSGRQSVTPGSTPTPRPPSAPTYSPGTTAGHSPITTPFAAPQPSPTVTNPSTPYNSLNTFTFSPVEDHGASFQPMEEQQQQHQDTKVNIKLEEPTTMMADSARLRNLLTKPPNSVESDSDSKNKHKILKGLLNQPDDDDNMNENNRNSPRTGNLSGRNSMPGPSDTKANTSGGNNMLLQLLNDKSDDDDRETRAGMKPPSELLQQLLKDDEQKTEMQSPDDMLLRSLGFRSSPSPTNGECRTRKRPNDDRDDSGSKRSGDVSSSSKPDGKLWRRNKMLASLLAKQPNPKPIPPVPNSVITATPQERLPKIFPDPASMNKSQPNRMMGGSGNATVQLQQNQQNTQQQHANQQQQHHQLAMNSNTTNSIMTNSRGPASRMLSGRPPTTNYLNQMLTTANNNIQRISAQQSRQFHQHQAQQAQQQQQMDSSAFPATSSSDAIESAGGVGPGPVAGLWEMQTTPDLMLSDILDQVIDFVPEAVMNNNDMLSSVLEAMDDQPTNSYLPRDSISEKMAINIIQKSLMQCETVVNNPSSPNMTMAANTPPAYSSVTVTNQTNQGGGFPPPPNYQRSPFQKTVLTNRQGGPQYAVAGGMTSTQQKKLIQPQYEKMRLLHQQSKQTFVCSSNTNVELGSDMQNIDSLLNTSVAPNVSLQRSSSVPESQLSPTFAGQVTQPSQRLNKQQPYSPHSQLASPGFAQTAVGNYQHGGSRLSPHSPFGQQLSPRQAYPQATTQNSNWSAQQAAQGQLSLQQQQNPMLNAQLTSNYVSVPGRNFPIQRTPQQQQRAIGSPGVAPTKHSPFPTDNFPPPGSPNSTFNQNQYLRLQRANSAPNATTQLPGGLGSPRPYGREPPTHASYPIPQTHHSMMYQQDPQYCYEQTGLQLPYNGADRGRVPPHLQAGVAGGGTTSEFVRQELRNVVGARSGQTQQSPNNRTQNQLLNQSVAPDLSELSHNFDLPTSGASESPKLWGTIGSDMGSMSPQPATSRTSMEEARQGDHSSQSSLLQKLLSDDRV